MTLRPRLVSVALAATAAALATAAPLSASAAPAPRQATTATSEAGETGRYLVRYTAGTDVAAAARGLRSQGVEVRRTFSAAVRAAVVDLTAGQAAALARSARVAAVEPDSRVQATETQVGAPWGLDRVDQRNLPLSTTYTAASTGAGIDVYVVDTGVLAEHTDFGGRVAPGWTAINDGRGSSDCDGHGTHVAGTIAGASHGVAKAATVVPVRVLDCEGSGFMSDVVAGLDWVAARHVTGTPAVVNLSLGGNASSTVDAALNGVVNDGVTAVVAAGNAATDACTGSPARVPAALTVAASDSTDRQASFSNYGSCVDLYAPGVSILSTWHTSTTATARLSGTSMASPHAAGAAAVLLAQQPSLTPAQVTSRLTGDATTGVVTAATAGTPNRLLFLAAPEAPAEVAPTPVLSAPEVATLVTAVAGKRSAAVSWAQGRDGGSPLTGQSVQIYVGSKRVGSVSVAATATGTRVTGLKPGTGYAFTVIATNAVGSSAESARSNVVLPLR